MNKWDSIMIPDSMSKIVCRVCLHTNFSEIEDVDDTLSEFHNELCRYDTFTNPAFKFCPICTHLLQKFHNFREKCRRANDILKIWIQNKDANDVTSLDGLMPPLLTVCKQKENDIIELSHFEESFNISIKIEEDFKTESLIIDALKLDLLEASIENNDIDRTDIDINYKIEDENDCDIEIKKSTKRKKSETERKISKTEQKISKTEQKISKTERKISKTERKTIKTRKSVKEESLLELSERIKAKRAKFSNNQNKLKDRILELIELGEFQDLDDNVMMTKELFLKMFEKSDNIRLRSILLLKPGSPKEMQRLRKFLLNLLKKNNPDHENIFDIEHLNTDEKKLAEFEGRKHTKEYIEAPIKCNICFKVFDVQRLLDYHNRWHDEGAGAHACPLCRMRFTSRKALAQHHNTNHARVFRCKLCPLVTYNPAMMVNHYNQHKGVEYSCPVCLSVFSNKNTLNNHRRQAHRTAHECPRCARSFVSEKGLYFHTRLKHRDEPPPAAGGVPCATCGALLAAAALRRHERDAHAPHQPACFHCKEVFCSLEELRAHKLAMDHLRPPKARRPPGGDDKVAEERPSCGECGKTYNSRKSYLRHFNLTHRQNRIQKCGFCQAKFRSSTELATHRAAAGHQRAVRAPRPRAEPGARARLRCRDPARPHHRCQLCSELVSTLRTTAMYQHFLSAHPDVPYSSVYAQPNNIHLCELCGKTFRDLTFFLDHKNVHSGLRPYRCAACPRAFASRRHLRLHAARHAPPRHACHICHKRFHSAGNLYAHTRGHIGDRRFKCDICGKGFLHAAALSEHVRGVHHHLRRRRAARET